MGKRSRHIVLWCISWSFWKLHYCILVMMILHFFSFCGHFSKPTNEFTVNLQKSFDTKYYKMGFDENLKDYNFEQNLFGPDWKHFYFLFCLWNCKGWELELEDCRKWAERRPTIVISPTTKMHSALNTHNQFSWFCSVRVIILKALCTIYTFWFIGLSF